MKPKHQGGYTAQHTLYCERTLVTLLRGLAPWKHGLYVVGGLVPRYLIPGDSGAEDSPAHIGTTDVDLVVNLDLLADVEAYRRLEQNLQSLGFQRGSNDEGQPRHYKWRKPIGEAFAVEVDLLCDAPVTEGGKAKTLPGEKRLSALGIAGAYLVAGDYIEVEMTEDLLDGRGVATETIRVANITSFLVLKSLAYNDRAEEKDAYDIVYCLTHYPDGPKGAAAEYVKNQTRLPDDVFLRRGLDILRDRFATDAKTHGYRKDGPVSYARFLTDPSRTNLDVVHQRDAAAVVEMFLGAV